VKEYTITIEETIAQEFKVMADNLENAVALTETNYENGKLVLENGEVQSKKIAVIKPDEEVTEWIEF